VARRARLREALGQVHEDELVALTRDLVRIPSVIRPGDPDGTEAAVAEHVARWLAKEGLTVTTDPVAPGRPNVIGTLEGGGPGPSLLLEGHTDVVTEGDPGAWTHAPFSGDLEGGRLWGRGAADMKGGLAAAMIAAAAVKRSGGPARGRLVVGALVDEEGDMLGVRRFAATPLGRELTAAIVCEPEQNELCLEQRGVVWARVTLRGRMAHGAMPEAGANPLTAVGALLREAARLQGRLRRLCARSRHLKPPTVTPTVVRSPLDGVPQSNVIPAAAEVVLDVRLTPGPDADTVAAEIDRACRAAADAVAGVEVTWRPVNGFRSATRVSRDEPLVTAMIDAVRAATGRRAVFGGVPGSTDGTILRETLGIPIVTCGPGHRLIPHQVDEHVEIAELVDAARIYVASALNYLEA
jgi:succinyl-diaminopimelate desuccinylase